MRHWRSTLLAGLVAGAAIAVPLAMWAGGGKALISVQTAPDGRERVELYGPTRSEAWLWDRGYDMPGHVRLTRIADSAPIATSPLFELSGSGRAIWTPAGVQLGGAIFDRASGRWHIEGG